MRHIADCSYYVISSERATANVIAFHSVPRNDPMKLEAPIVSTIVTTHASKESHRRSQRNEFIHGKKLNLMQIKDSFPVIDALQASNWSEEHFRSLADAGADAIHVTVAFWHDCKETLAHIGKWNRWFKEHENLILPVREAGDIERAHKSGRTGIILGFQNSSPIEDDFSLIEIFHQLGVRVMQLTYNNQNLVGTGCYEEKDAGLTKFGRMVVREMNRLGMIVDVSHTAEKTCFDAIQVSERPIAITHANPLSFRDVVRNKSDDLLLELARSGGMLGFSLYPLHLSNGSDCSLKEFCEMVCRTADLIGVEHLGLGTDLCLGWDSGYLAYMRSGTWDDRKDRHSELKWPDYPAWFRKAEDLQNVADGLESAGFSDAEVRAIMGGNWHRFFHQGLSRQE